MYKLYADGACSQNKTWEGGWGYVILKDDIDLKRQAGYEPIKTTNQRMEITAILKGLKELPEKSEIEIYTDSMYCVNTINTWLEGWEFARILETKANNDLWKDFINLRNKMYKIKAIHVKGHNNNYYNEICNGLAQNAIKYKGSLIV